MSPAAVPSEDPDLRRQVEAIHASLQTVLSRLEERRESRAPLPGGEEEGDENARLLANMDVDIQHARTLARTFRKEGAGKSFAAWLEKRIPVVGRILSRPCWERRSCSSVLRGGKDDSIAKLAAIHSLWEKKRVLLLTADTYRIAAVEQLRTYARILGIPIEVVYEPEEIPSLLQKHEEMDLILMDTAGRSQRDGKRLDELCGLYESYRPEAVHLVMSANMKYGDMLDVIDRMGVVPVSCLLFTKLDETLTYGNLMNAVLDFDRPISFVTTGQNVPNDIEGAQPERIARLLVGGDRVGR
jgi:flagellar biosynthesis protein FlhF